MHAAPFLDDDDRLQTYGAMRKVAIDSLMMSEPSGVMARPLPGRPNHAMTGKIVAYDSRTTIVVRADTQGTQPGASWSAAARS